MLLFELVMLRRKARRRTAGAAAALDGDDSLTSRWLRDGLPFTPTGDQARAIAQIETDLADSRPMQRLLMGEVGSGKTVVALAAMLRAVEHGMQAALMAPTETLADQHFATIQRLLGGESVSAALLTGSTAGVRRADTLSKLASGELSLLVGTHALIEDAVAFDRLAVAVVDEQHRFGVDQRRRLARKADGIGMCGLRPHMLFLTATPIPRTLALTAYGDLDTTSLRELPSGRKPVETHVAGSDRERERAYERIREELRAGRQAFVVCPLVEESEALQAKAATAEYERLRRTELADFEVVLLHGQMRPKAKQEAMAAFAEGGADVLVATSVIEVGIDVPNATVMLVENAERYGISQLHQLRGRVGRGEHESVCILFGPGDSSRLRALAEHHDGFRLAEIDLELRGKGEIIGTRQHGAADFRVARLPEDDDLLERARAHAADLLDADPELTEPEHALLALALGRAYGAEALEPIPA
jgi:ATP-dependent DNA helicase RecG